MDVDTVLSTVSDIAFCFDSDMKVNWINEAASKTMGLSGDQAQGKHCRELLSETVFELIEEKCIKLGEALVGIPMQIQIEDKSPIDGSLYASAKIDAEGEIESIFALIEDVTEKNFLEKTLEEQAGHLEQYHASTMELAIGLSDCFQVLDEARKGNLGARVDSTTSNSSEEIVARMGQALNDTMNDLERQIETIARQQMAIQELSTPVLQLWDDVLALPVIGIVDTRRSAEIMERLLTEVTERQTRYVILDITGVELVDTKTADHFIKVIKAAELLGAKCIMTGIRPAVAQTMVEIGIDLSSVITLRNLQQGLAECLRLMGHEK